MQLIVRFLLLLLWGDNFDERWPTGGPCSPPPSHFADRQRYPLHCVESVAATILVLGIYVYVKIVFFFFLLADKVIYVPLSTRSRYVENTL